MRPLIAVLFVASIGTAPAQTVLHTNRGPAEQRTPGLLPLPATSISDAIFQAILTEADATSRGEAWFTYAADYTDPVGNVVTPVTIRVPIASTQYPYGEERTCDLSDPAHPRLTFTAGLDEKNYAPYRPAAAKSPPQEFRLSLNKYLCRVLAAPFRCNGSAVTLAPDLAHWSVASEAAIVLSSDAPATLTATSIRTVRSNTPFQLSQCSVIAPSGGLCCIAGKTTEWHCGGTPTGTGWHQVSGECFHRTSGGTCSD